MEWTCLAVELNKKAILLNHNACVKSPHIVHDLPRRKDFDIVCRLEKNPKFQNN